MALTRTIDGAKIVELDITKFDSHCCNVDYTGKKQCFIYAKFVQSKQKATKITV